MPARHTMRWTAYAGVSTALAGAVIVKAVAQRPNFYSAAVYLSQSSANLLILTNLVFVVACTLVFGLQKVLYGPLRPIEVEQLYERGWFAVTETCLAMTIFRGAIGPWFVAMFFALLVGKVWQWIGEGRVEVLEQQQHQQMRNPGLFHTRLALSLGLSVFFDLTMLEYVVKQVMRMPRPDMMVMFGFEFAVLSIMSLSTAVRYALALVEISIVREQKRKRAAEMHKERVERAERRIQEAERETTSNTGPEGTQGSQESQPTREQSLDQAREELRRAREEAIDDNEVDVEGWEARGRYIFYLDLATDFFKLVIYLLFFCILLVFYGLPLHIMRDVFLTARSFFKRISDFIKYRTATRDMNERFPDATELDIAAGDVCIICREEMRPVDQQAQPQGQPQPPPSPLADRMRPKKLPCGHILHFSCLRSWLERQQVCPTCRGPVLTGAGTGAAAAGAAGAAGAGAGAGPGPGPGPAAVDANGQPIAPDAAPAQRPQAGQGGVARVFQFGPLRIGFGAARGDHMLEELQQQMQDRRPEQAGLPDRDRGQQYGFGIRWDGMPRWNDRRENQADQNRDRDGGSGFGSGSSLREQLDRVERQMQEEMRTLSQNAREYIALRHLHNELERLRAARTMPAGGAAAGTTTAGAAAGTTTAGAGVPLHTTPLAAATTTATTTIPQRLQVPSSEHHIHAGSPELPPGMVLPEGWSMVPLRPVPPQPQQQPQQRQQQQPHPHIPTAATTFTIPPTTIQTTFTSPAPVPQHIRAMFSDMPVRGQTPTPTQARPQVQAQTQAQIPSPVARDPATQQLHQQQQPEAQAPSQVQGHIVQQVARPQQPRQEGGVINLNLQRIATQDNSPTHATTPSATPATTTTTTTTTTHVVSAAAPVTPSTPSTPSAPSHSEQVNGNVNHHHYHNHHHNHNHDVNESGNGDRDGDDESESGSESDNDRDGGTHAIPRRSFGQPSPVTPQPLPIWGTTSTTTSGGGPLAFNSYERPRELFRRPQHQHQQQQQQHQAHQVRTVGVGVGQPASLSVQTDVAAGATTAITTAGTGASTDTDTGSSQTKSGQQHHHQSQGQATVEDALEGGEREGSSV